MAKRSPADPPAVSFETYCEVIKGLRMGGLTTHSCPDCKTRNVVQVARIGQAPCPVCGSFDLDVKASKGHFERLIATRRAHNQAAMGSIGNRRGS